MSCSKSGPIGAMGTHAETAIRKTEIRRVGGLVFDIDAKHLSADLAASLLGYLDDVLPEAELRSTSLEGNLHAVLRFKKPVRLKYAEKIWRLLQRLVLSDPSASILAKARVVGSLKKKSDDDCHVVTLIHEGKRVSAKQLLADLMRVEVDGNGKVISSAQWKRRQFAALMTRLRAPNDRVLWDGTGSHSICPIHGSGANPKQFAIDAAHATGSCFGDCGENGSPKRVPLTDIVRARAVAPESWDRFAGWFEEGPASPGNRPVVEHNPLRPLRYFYVDLLNVLAATKRFYRYGGHIAEIRGDRLRPLTTPEALVGAVVDNMEVASSVNGSRVFKRLSNEDAKAILHADKLLTALPELDYFCEIPVFDAEFRLINAGYDATSRIYCAGQSIQPSPEATHLMAFLEVINFREKASRDNYVGALLTNFFQVHFPGAKPVEIYEANRPLVGKTALARCAASVGTNRRVGTVSYTPNDEEFEKKLAAHTLKANFVLIDNAKTKRSVEVSSPTLERSITDDWLSYRQLGFTKLIERPNHVTWMISMNNARLSPDLTSRGLPIRLRYDGDPTRRRSPIGDPTEYFARHLPDIRAELIGMIMRWIAAGRPECIRPFRFKKWSRTIGGILAVNGFDDFLLNLDDSRVEFDPVLSSLREMAEQWPDQFTKAADWLQLIKPQGLLDREWSGAATERAQASNLGKLFTSYNGETFRITRGDGREKVATLRSRQGHGGQEWGFMTGEDGDGGGGGGGGGGERGERQNGRSPSRSPAQVPKNKGLMDGGERGERKLQQEQEDSLRDERSPLTPVGQEGGPEDGFRSPRSPRASRSRVTTCKHKYLPSVNEVVNTPVNMVNAANAGVDTKLQQPSSHGVQPSSDPDNVLNRLRNRCAVAPVRAKLAKFPIAVPTRSLRLGSEVCEYQVGWDGHPLEHGVLALDTETTVVEDDACVPELVLASVSDGTRHLVMAPDQVADYLVAHQSHSFIFHNVAFDFWVLERYFADTRREDARDVLWAMARGNQLRDSMILDQLMMLARTGAAPVPRNLAVVAQEFAAIQVDKSDPYRLRYSEIRGLPLASVDCGFLDYAATDAIATIHTYAGLAAAADELMQRHTDLYDTELSGNFGLLSEGIQVQAAIALSAISRNGMHVDNARLTAIRRDLERRRGDLVAAVEAALPGGSQESDRVLFQRGRDGQVLITNAGHPRVNNKALQAALREVQRSVKAGAGIAIDVPLTPRSGALSLKAGHWEPFRAHHPFIDKWLALSELAKLIQFTREHATERVNPRYAVLVRTGRTSCSGPNIQQLPREGGIRECFIPRPGHVLLSIDYSFIELVTLAAVCEFRFGQSKLADAIREGIDPHENTAAMIRGMSIEEFRNLKDASPVTYKADRQKAKAINFGAPGGLGAASLMTYASSTFGVKLTLEEAEALRSKLITEVYPELSQYLADDLMASLASNLGVDVVACWNALDDSGERTAWLPAYIRNIVGGRTHRKDGEPYDPDLLERSWERLRTLNRCAEFEAELAAERGSAALAGRLFRTNVASLTGRVRGNVAYTQARNTPFQGLAADGAKLALFHLIDAGYRVVAFVHDEVLIELPIDADHTACATKITQIMCRQMRRVTGNVPVSCGGPVLMDRWAKDAKPVHDEDGRLVVWRPAGD